MAKSTAAPDDNAGEGMLGFIVTVATIRDSLGRYCEAGDTAYLTRPIASALSKKNHVRMEIPEHFGDADDPAHQPTEAEQALQAALDEQTKMLGQLKADLAAAENTSAKLAMAEVASAKDELKTDELAAPAASTDPGGSEGDKNELGKTAATKPAKPAKSAAGKRAGGSSVLD